MKETGAFDFTAWRALAESDPAQFERRRKAVINQLIRTADNDIARQRMKQLAGQIERYRNAEDDPHIVLGHLLALLNRLIENRLIIASSQVKEMLQEGLPASPEKQLPAPKTVDAVCADGPGTHLD